jgi:tetratricopeptide (TPR) repeat protein
MGRTARSGGTPGNRGQRRIIDEVIARLRGSGDQERLAEAYLRKGDLHTTLRQFDAANEALEESLRLRRAVQRGEPRTLRSLGFLRWYQGRNDAALSWAQEALRLDRRDHNTVAVIDDLTNLATIHSSGREYEQARHCLEEALTLCQPVSSGAEPDFGDLWSRRLNLLHHYGQVLTEQGELDRALECLSQPAEWARLRLMPRQASYLYSAMAQVHLRKGEASRCLEYYRQAIDITRRAHYAVELQEAAEVFAELRDRPAEAQIWARLAVAHEGLGNYGAARSAWEQDRALRKEIGDRPGELKALEGQGRMARRHLPASAALRFYEEAIDLAAAIGNHEAAARLGNAAGIIEWTRGRHVEALSHFERALALFEDAGDRAGAGLMMNSIAITLGLLGRRPEARERLEDAVQHHRDTAQTQLEGHALAALGDWYWEAGEVERAAEWYDRSLRVRQTIGDVRGEGWMLQRLARARDAAGDRQDARALLARATNLSSQCSDEELMHACADLGQKVAS